jgi:hypothetical protein
MADTIEETTEAVETVETPDAPETEAVEVAIDPSEGFAPHFVVDDDDGEQVEDSGAVESPEMETPELSTEMIQRAKEFNMTEETARGLGAETLAGMFAGIDRRIMNPQQQAQHPVQQQQQQAPMPTEFVPLKIEFSEDVDESLTAPFNSFMEQVNQRLAEGHTFRQETVQKQKRDVVRGQLSEMDTYLSDLGPEWESVYGKTATLQHQDMNDPFALKRLEIWGGAARAFSDAARAGHPISKAESFKRAHHSVNWDKIAEKTREKMNGQVADRQKSFGNRSTGKGTSPPKKLTTHEKAIVAAGG